MAKIPLDKLPDFNPLRFPSRPATYQCSYCGRAGHNIKLCPTRLQNLVKESQRQKDEDTTE